MAEFFTASGACIVANLITHPLETIKTYQQLPQRAGISTLRSAVLIVRKNGLLALYKGLNASLVRAVISGGGRLYLFDIFKDTCYDRGLLTRRMGRSQPVASELPLRGFLASSAGMIAALVSSPIDLVRTRQAAFKGSFGDSPSMIQVMENIVSTTGFRGLFSGSTALLARAFWFNLAQLTTYDSCKTIAMDRFELGAEDVRTHVLASTGAGFVATTISSPFENIKTDMQLVRSRSVASVAEAMYQRGGIKHFFRGWLPLYLKVGPHTLIVFVTAEYLRQLFSLRSME